MSAITRITEFISGGWLTDMMFALMLLWFAFNLFRKRTVSGVYSRRLFLGFTVITTVSLVLVYAVYQGLWRQSDCGPLCRYFLPPYSNYYLNEVVVRWMSTFAFNATVGLFGGLVFLFFARATRGQIIDQLDVDVLTVGGMIAGWPNILIFYGLVFSLTVMITVVRAIVFRTARVRMIITPALPLAGAFVAVFGDKLAQALRLYEIGVTLV